MKKQIKKRNNQLIQSEVDNLKTKILPLVIEKKELLNFLKVESIKQFESELNEKTGFVKASLSAEALGYEAELKRLHVLEKKIGGKLSKNDIDKNNNNIKLPILERISEKHTTYYTPEELKTLEDLERVVKLFNEIDYNDRKSLIINREYKLVVNPFAMRI